MSPVWTASDGFRFYYPKKRRKKTRDLISSRNVGQMSWNWKRFEGLDNWKFFTIIISCFGTFLSWFIGVFGLCKRSGIVIVWRGFVDLMIWRGKSLIVVQFIGRERNSFDIADDVVYFEDLWIVFRVYFLLEFGITHEECRRIGNFESRDFVYFPARARNEDDLFVA